MALHPNFPRSPYAELVPDQRWFPAAEELRSTAYEKLLPPLVAKIRAEVADWRNQGYAGAASRAESGPDYRFIYVDQEGYERNSPHTFAAVAASFGEYQED